MIERGNFLVYIEGERIEFSNLSINLSANTPSTASISIPSSFSAPDIIPYSLVHIFYWDDQSPVEDGNGKVTRRGEWFLLWEGVTVGASYKKNPKSSYYSINCMDLFTYMYKTQVSLFDLTVFDLHYSKKMAVIGQKEFLVKSNTFEEWIESYFLPGKNITPQGQIVEQADGNLTSSSEESLLELAQNFIEKWSTSIPLLDFHMSRLKFSDKFISVDDETIRSFFNVAKMNAYLERNIRTWKSGSNILDVFSRILQTAYYNYVNVGPCVYSGSPRQYILKPNSYFITPPKCNVIFPDMITDINSSIDHMESVTRTFINANVRLKSNGLSMTYVGPKELQEFLTDKKDLGIKYNSPQKAIAAEFKKSAEEIKRKEDSDSTNAKRVTGVVGEEDTFKTFYTKEEVEGFVNTRQIGLDSALATIDSDDAGETKSDGTEVENEGYNERLARLSQYYHDLSKYGDNTSTMVLKFSPQLVVNFPVVSLDRHHSEIGSLVNITHSINANGSAFTTVNINLTRDLRPETEDVDAPPFISSNYSNRIRINDTYKELLGCSAVTENATETISKVESDNLSNFIAKIMNDVFSLDGSKLGAYYDSEAVGKSVEFVKNYTRRSGLTTLKDLKEYYGLSTNSESEDGNDDSWKSTGSENNPFDYSRAADFLGDKLTPNVKNALFENEDSDQYIGEEHKKNKIIEIKNKYKGIIDGR